MQISRDLWRDVLTLAGMTENSAGSGHEDDEGSTPPLPENLAALIGAIQGPADLGRNHDKYLAYPDREQAGGAASA
jgi:hypothetical protein